MNLLNRITNRLSRKEKQTVEIGERKQRRKLEGKLKLILTTLCVAMSVFHLYIAIVYGMNPLQQRNIHLVFVLVIIFLLYPASNKSNPKKPTVVDWALIVLSILAVGSIYFRYPSLVESGGIYEPQDIIFGAITILLIFEATRRTVGWSLPILSIIILIYGLLGERISGPLRHSGFSFIRIIQHLTLTTEGIYGQVLGVSSTYIFLFILFGAFLSVTGLSQVFNDIALSLAGSLKGGPAKVSVVASGLMGSVSGSATANVVTTGSFTIPLMKKLGYSSTFAASVEAAASTGGQIMPPIMGSAAFIMADKLGVSYLYVTIAAILPAVLYFFSVWMGVHFRACKLDIHGMPRNELPSLKYTLLNRGHLIIPLIGIIYLLVAGYPATNAAVGGIVLSIVSSFLKKETRIKFKDLIVAMEDGVLSAIPVAISCAIIGIVVGIITLTGAILSVGNAILSLAGGLLLPALTLTMLVCIVMGMGMPTTAVYVLASVMAAPTLVKLGITPLQAHFFVFYYGILSTITPPVAISSYAAAGIAGSNPNKTGWAAVKLALAGFIIPYMFIYSSELLILPNSGVPILTTIRVILTSILGIICLSVATEGFFRRKLNIIERILYFVASLLLIDSGTYTDVIGIIIFASLFFIQIKFSKTKKIESQTIL